jgi:hypothetical protein
MDGVCFELNISYSVWMISYYEKGQFQRYEKEVTSSQEKRNIFSKEYF